MRGRGASRRGEEREEEGGARSARVLERVGTGGEGRGGTHRRPALAALAWRATRRECFLPGWSNHVLTRDCQSLRKWLRWRTLRGGGEEGQRLVAGRCSAAALAAVARGSRERASSLVLAELWMGKSSGSRGEGRRGGGARVSSRARGTAVRARREGGRTPILTSGVELCGQASEEGDEARVSGRVRVERGVLTRPQPDRAPASPGLGARPCAFRPVPSQPTACTAQRPRGPPRRGEGRGTSSRLEAAATAARGRAASGCGRGVVWRGRGADGVGSAGAHVGGRSGTTTRREGTRAGARLGSRRREATGANSHGRLAQPSAAPTSLSSCERLPRHPCPLSSTPSGPESASWPPSSIVVVVVARPARPLSPLAHRHPWAPSQALDSLSSLSKHHSGRRTHPARSSTRRPSSSRSTSRSTGPRLRPVQRHGPPDALCPAQVWCVRLLHTPPVADRVLTLSSPSFSSPHLADSPLDRSQSSSAGRTRPSSSATASPATSSARTPQCRPSPPPSAASP